MLMCQLHVMNLFLMVRLPRKSTLFPYTTLFRSDKVAYLLKAQSLGETERRLPDFPKPINDRRLPGPVTIAASIDRKSTRLNSSHVEISYAVFCLKKKTGDISCSSLTSRLADDSP